jgi:hypothetical protein
MKYPELSDEENNKVLQRFIEAAHPLSTDEIAKLEALLAVKRKAPLAKLTQILNIPSWRQHQLYAYLRAKPGYQLRYHKGQWFVRVKP